MKIVILGCGRVGSMLALALEDEGHQVSIIDKKKDAFRRLPARFKGQAVFGIGIDEDVLKKAGIEEADAFIALTQGDNSNVMASQVVQERFHVGKVLCRVYDPIRAEVFRELGIHTIPTARLLCGLFADMLTDQPVQSIGAYLGEALEPKST
jgi:trk system potassium uptake protein TrkA